MFRTLGVALMAFAGIVALVWLLQLAGLVAAIEEPAPGIVAFGSVGAALYVLGRRGAGRRSAENFDKR